MFVDVKGVVTGTSCPLRDILEVKASGDEVCGSPDIAELRAAVANLVEVLCVLWFCNVVPKGMLFLSVPRIN